MRGELAIEGDQPDVYRTHKVPVALQCVAAPEACRGTMHLGIGFLGRTTPISGRGPFSMPPVKIA